MTVHLARMHHIHIILCLVLVQPRKNHPNMTAKTVYWDAKNQHKQIQTHVSRCIVCFITNTVKQFQNSSSKKKDNPASDKDIEIATLKALLKEMRKANNRLRKQNRRQQQVCQMSSVNFNHLSDVKVD